VTAAELLRWLDKAATAGPWVCRNDAIYADHIRHDAGRETLPRWVAQASKMSDPEHTYAEVFATARLIATTRNLLPLLAGLVEAAVAFDAADAAVRAKQDEADLDLLRRCEPEWFANRDALKSAIAALEAAAKEGV
jgi:hypothetical protein